MRRRYRGSCRRIGIGLLLLSVLPLASCGPSNPNLDKPIHGPVTLGKEWLEIVPPEPLKCERYESEVLIWFATRYQTNNVGLKFPDGSTVLPEVQLVSEDGEVFYLTEAGLSDTGVAFGRFAAEHKPNLPKDKSFTKVRIRSDKPIECKEIVWRNYNPWDFK